MRKSVHNALRIFEHAAAAQPKNVAFLFYILDIHPSFCYILLNKRCRFFSPWFGVRTCREVGAFFCCLHGCQIFLIVLGRFYILDIHLPLCYTIFNKGVSISPSPIWDRVLWRSRHLFLFPPKSAMPHALQVRTVSHCASVKVVVLPSGASSNPSFLCTYRTSPSIIRF